MIRIYDDADSLAYLTDIGYVLKQRMIRKLQKSLLGHYLIRSNLGQINWPNNANSKEEPARNTIKERIEKGAYWEDRCHAAAVEIGEHLSRCIDASKW